MLVDICVVVQPNGVEHAKSLAVIPEVECLKHPELKSKTEELEARICQHKQSCHGHIRTLHIQYTTRSPHSIARNASISASGYQAITRIMSV